MATNISHPENNVRDLFLKIAENFDKSPTLKYAANNARIFAEQKKYSASDIQSCPELVAPDEREKKPNNIVAWHDLGRKLDREIYYNKETNEVEEEYEVIGMRMEPDKDHRDYWIKFN